MSRNGATAQLEMNLATGGMVRGAYVAKRESCKLCGAVEDERVVIHHSRKRCMIACGVLLVEEKHHRPCDGCGRYEKEDVQWERPELPGHVWCWPCASEGAAFWEWTERMWNNVGELLPLAVYPFDEKREMKGRHKEWPHLRKDGLHGPQAEAK